MKRGSFACVREDGSPKKKYKSREIAEMHARQLETTVLYKITVYECPTCKRWHCGSRKDTLSERVLKCSPVFKPLGGTVS